MLHRLKLRKNTGQSIIYKFFILAAKRSSELSPESPTVTSGTESPYFSGIVYATVIPSGKSGTGPEEFFSSSSETSDTNSIPIELNVIL